MAVEKGHLRLVQLVENKADVSSGDESGRTPLSVAALNGHWEVARFLVVEKADLKVIRDDMTGAWHLAVEKNYIDVTKVLLKVRVDVNLESR